MKIEFFSMLMILFTVTTINAQMYVSPSNRVGVGLLTPDSKLQIANPPSSNEKGLLLGYYGNDIQGRYGNCGIRQSCYNGDLILNYWAGNVGIGMLTPSFLLDVDGIIRADNVSINSDSTLKTKIEKVKNPRPEDVALG